MKDRPSVQGHHGFRTRAAHASGTVSTIVPHSDGTALVDFHWGDNVLVFKRVKVASVSPIVSRGFIPDEPPTAAPGPSR
jgi:hypothetical protein